MEDLTGRTIGGYQIVEKIGRGGMATVFKAYQPSLDRDVAIKVLPPYYAEQDETFLQRFKREARAIAKLRHPNILMVMDYGEEDDIAYLVMEYVTAGTLKERMKRPIKLDQIYNLVGQVGSALQYAHDQGIVHRDIKPANIMLPKPDWALLTDFGLATMVGGSFLTQSGMTVGTPAYMSPEQGGGERVDHRTDIYALGIMLYEMVVGEVPYTAETPMAVVVKHIVDPLPIPREKNPEIPEELQRVILKSLAKNPDDRYQRAADFVAALQKVANVHPDWSATEIRAVTDIRTPQVDRAETKRFEDEELTAVHAEEAEASLTVAEPQPEPAMAEVPEPLPAEEISRSAVPEPAIEVAEAATIGPAEAVQVKLPAPRKKRRWPLYLGGFAILAFLGLVVLGILSGDGNEQNLATETLPGAAVGLPTEQSGEAAKPPSGEEEMGRVAELLRNGEFERAREIVSGVLRRFPNMWEPFMGLVGAQLEAGNTERAAKLLETGLEAHPDAPPENYAALGFLYQEVGQPLPALEAFENTLQRYPGYLEAHEGLMNTARETDKIGRGVGFLEGLREQFPDEPLIYRSLAELYRADNNLDAALETINAALERAPDNPKILITAYHVFIDIGNREEALGLMERALELEPNNPEVLSQAGWAYINYGQPERARPLFEKVLPMDENNGWNIMGMARVLIALKEETDRVPEMLRKVEFLGKEQQDAWMLIILGYTYREMADCQTAVRIFKLAQEIEPDSVDARQGINSCQ